MQWHTKRDRGRIESEGLGMEGWDEWEQEEHREMEVLANLGDSETEQNSNIGHGIPSKPICKIRVPWSKSTLRFLFWNSLFLWRCTLTVKRKLKGFRKQKLSQGELKPLEQTATRSVALGIRTLPLQKYAAISSSPWLKFQLLEDNFILIVQLHCSYRYLIT